MGDHGPVCWAIHHECAVKRIVEMDRKLDEYGADRQRMDKDVGTVERTKRYDEHWTTACDHLGCRIKRLRQHYDEARGPR